MMFIFMGNDLTDYAGSLRAQRNASVVPSEMLRSMDDRLGHDSEWFVRMEHSSVISRGYTLTRTRRVQTFLFYSFYEGPDFE